MAQDGTPDTGTPDGADTPDAAEPKPKRKIPWKKIGKIGVPILFVIVAAVAVLGLMLPTVARDPVARGGLATETQARTMADTNLRTDLEQKLGDKASTADLAALQQKSRDNLQAAIGLLPTKADVQSAVDTETQARRTVDTGLDTRIGGLELTLNNPDDPATGVVGQLEQIKAQLAPPLPVPPPNQVHPQVLHPVR